MKETFVENERIRIMVCQQNDTLLHNHDFLEMVYVREGKAIHTLNGRDMVVKKGDYFIIDYGAYHKYTTMEHENFEIINTLFRPELIDKTLINCLSFQDLLNHYLIRFSYKASEASPTSMLFFDEGKQILHLIEKMQWEYNNQNHGSVELIRCYLIEIMILTMRKIQRRQDEVLYDDYSKYIVDYVEENYMEQITLTQLSAKLNFSLPYLCKRFKSDVGISFNEYLQKKRIEQSCRLIANTDKKISEIAGLVGYNDIKFFNQVFKKHLRLTPGEFKKMHRQA